jgi:hypothetical protein
MINYGKMDYKSLVKFAGLQILHIGEILRIGALRAKPAYQE